MPDRSPRTIDDELSLAVKARNSATQQISQLSQDIVRATARIDALLAERSATLVVVCPDTPESLIVQTSPETSS